MEYSRCKNCEFMDSARIAFRGSGMELVAPTNRMDMVDLSIEMLSVGHMQSGMQGGILIVNLQSSAADTVRQQ
jgi:hypothetical protein